MLRGERDRQDGSIVAFSGSTAERKGDTYSCEDPGWPVDIIPCHNYTQTKRRKATGHPHVSRCSHDNTIKCSKFKGVGGAIFFFCQVRAGCHGWRGFTSGLGKAGRGMPGRPSLLWMAVAETIWAEDIEAMLCRALSFTAWSFNSSHKRLSAHTQREMEGGHVAEVATTSLPTTQWKHHWQQQTESRLKGDEST